MDPVIAIYLFGRKVAQKEGRDMTIIASSKSLETMVSRVLDDKMGRLSKLFMRAKTRKELEETLAEAIWEGLQVSVLRATVRRQDRRIAALEDGVLETLLGFDNMPEEARTLVEQALNAEWT